MNHNEPALINCLGLRQLLHMNLDVKLLVFKGGETSQVRRQKSQRANQPGTGGERARGRTSKGRRSQTPQKVQIFWHQLVSVGVLSEIWSKLPVYSRLVWSECVWYKITVFCSCMCLLCLAARACWFHSSYERSWQSKYNYAKHDCEWQSATAGLISYICSTVHLLAQSEFFFNQVEVKTATFSLITVLTTKQLSKLT